jgi:hypothetical protein
MASPYAGWLAEQAEMLQPAACGAWAFMAPGAVPLQHPLGLLAAAELSGSACSSNSDDMYASSVPLPGTNGSSASCSSLDALLDEHTLRPAKVFVMLPLDAVCCRSPCLLDPRSPARPAPLLAALPP